MTSKVNYTVNLATEWFKFKSYAFYMLDIGSRRFDILAWHIISMFNYINDTLPYNYYLRKFSWNWSYVSVTSIIYTVSQKIRFTDITISYFSFISGSLWYMYLNINCIFNIHYPFPSLFAIEINSSNVSMWNKP